MFANMAAAATRYAIRQRSETAASTAAIPKNGKRYRSWTRVGRTKKAIASTASPTSIVIRSGRRATSHITIAAATRKSTAPTIDAGNAPTIIPGVHDCVLAGQLARTQSPIRRSPEGIGLIVESQIHVLVRARLSSPPPPPARVSRAHGLNAFTVRYG